LQFTAPRQTLAAERFLCRFCIELVSVYHKPLVTSTGYFVDAVMGAEGKGQLSSLDLFEAAFHRDRQSRRGRGQMAQIDIDPHGLFARPIDVRIVETGLGISFATVVRELPVLEQRKLQFLPLDHYFEPDCIGIVTRREKKLLFYQQDFVDLLLGQPCRTSSGRASERPGRLSE